METPSVIARAIGIGNAWLIFAGLTGADEWLKYLFGKTKNQDLAKRVANLERHLDELSKK